MEITRIIIIYLVVMGAFFGPVYFSNRKKKKQRQEMLDNLKQGVKVITIGGIYGKVENVLTETVEVKIDKNVKITVSKEAIARVEK